jgi:hypothetical protein
MWSASFIRTLPWSAMTALLDLDANLALSHAVSLMEEAAAALADIPMDAVMAASLGEELVRLRRLTRQLEAASATVSQRFAASYEWADNGARSPVRWIQGSSNDSFESARSVIDRGALISDFPCVGSAWRRGEISAQHIDALARLRRRYAALSDDLIAIDDAITEVARRCEPREFYERLRHLCHQVNPDAVNDRDRTRPTGLHVSLLLDGLVRVDGTLDAELGGRFMAALESARRDLPQDSSPDGHGAASHESSSCMGSDVRTTSQRNLDGLRRILDAAGAATGDLSLPLITGERPTLNVTVPIEALVDEDSAEAGWLEQFGVPMTMLTGAAARRLACDASMRPLLVDRQGQLIAMMPKVRTIHPALRRAVFIRDRHCRFTGCRSRIDEVHHIVYYRKGGETVLSNLVGLCWHHHHLIHDGGWHIEGDPGGRLVFRSGRRRELTSDPPAF